MTRAFTKIRIAAAIAGALGLAAFALSAGAQPAPQSAAAGQPPRAVRTALVAPVPADRSVTLYGITRAGDRAELAFEVGGRISDRAVEVGDTVAAGEVLARLDRGSLDHAARAADSRVRELDSRLRQLGRDRDRAAQLVAAGAGLPADLEGLEAELEAAQATRAGAEIELREARRRRSEAELVAPFSGVVTDVGVERGERAQPGVPVLALAGSGVVEVEIEVPESLVAKLTPGQLAEVTLPLGGGREIACRTRSVGRAAQRAGRLFPVIVACDEADGVAPGMSAEVRLRVPRTPALMVPAAAVLDPTGARSSIFVVDGELARRIEVTTGELVDEGVAVQGDLDQGAEVIVAGHAGLLDGDRIEVVK
jgi:membrane fusion protein, multidrug efflux system